MTATTNNGKNRQHQEQQQVLPLRGRMTAQKTNNDKNKQRQEQATARTDNDAGQLVEVDDAALQGHGGGLGAVGGAEFAEQVVDVGLDSGLGDEEGGGDLLVALAGD